MPPRGNAPNNNGKRPYSEMTQGDDANTNYQPPFKVGGMNPQRKDHRAIDQAYQQMGNFQNMKKETIDRLQKFIDHTDGDVDLNKVARHMQKNKDVYGDPPLPSGASHTPTNGFVTGTQ
jgi:hypothetical protein